jgi:hypothetical protein
VFGEYYPFSRHFALLISLFDGFVCQAVDQMVDLLLIDDAGLLSHHLIHQFFKPVLSKAQEDIVH